MENNDKNTLFDNEFNSDNLSQEEFAGNGENQEPAENSETESGTIIGDTSYGFTDEQAQTESGYYQKSGSDIIQDNNEYNNGPGVFAGVESETNSQTADGYNSYGYNYNYNYNKQSGYQPNVSLDNNIKPKKSHGFATVFFSVVLSAAVAVTSCFAVLRYSDSAKTGKSYGTVKSSSDSSSIENVNINIDEEASSIAQAVSRKCNKSVVGIRTTISTSSFFFGSNSSTGEGSGVVYSKDGYIITNYHVIQQALAYTSAKIDVYLENVSTKPYSATVVGYNIASDLAVLKINAGNLTPVELGNSDDLSVGQYAITIGAPGGLEFMGSVTYGVISGLNRVVSSDSTIKLIQTDAAINPGNSGGALLDQSGSLIGINSSKIVSEEFEGMGFAIPVNTVKKICDNIIANKDKAEPYVGVTVSEKYTADVLKDYGYPTGAVVLSVADGSTAQTCGINRGDIITKFNGTAINEYTDYYKALKKCTIGSEVEIEIYRSGRYYTATLKVASNSYGN